MKKTIVLITSFALFTAFMFGCTNPAMPSAVAEKLEYSLNTLQYAVKNLDTIDNAYLVNPDVSPTIYSNKYELNLTATPRKQLGGGSVAKVMTTQAQPVILSDNQVSNAKASNVVKLEDNSEVVSHETTQNNAIPFEDTSSTREMQQINYNNSETEKIVTEDNFVKTTNHNNESAEKQKLNDKKITNNQEVEQISDESGLVNNDNNLNNENTNITDNKANENLTNNEATNNNYPTFRNYKRNFNYSPRYVNNKMSNDSNEQHLENYIAKVENLYTMTNDAIEANNMLTTCKESLLNCISELRTLAIEMKNGDYTPSTQQINAINNYISDIRTTISRIRSTNGQLNNEVNKINNYDKEGLTTSVDILNSNYIRILNHIDVRITYLKNALATLDQVKMLLLEAQSLDQLELQNAINYNAEMEENTNNAMVEEAKEKPAENLNDFLVEDEKINNDELENDELNNNTVTDKKEVTNNEENEKVNDETINPLLPMNENEAETVEKEVAPTGETANQDENRQTSETNNDQQTENVNNNNKVVNNTSEEKQNISAQNQTNQTPYSNIDTYNGANTEESNEIMARMHARKNTDTYNNPKTNLNNRNNQNNNPNNNNINNTNTPNNDNFNVANNNAQGGVNNAGINDGGVAGGYNNGMNNVAGYNNGMNNAGVSNGMNNAGINNGMANDINTPSGTFQNGIITQNNLNQGVNNGVNGVRTGYNGSTNNPYTVDSKGRNRNINTYGQNTLIDIINRGTVNNGINTLNLNPIDEVNNSKPNMVSGDDTIIHPNGYMVAEPIVGEVQHVERIIA